MKTIDDEVFDRGYRKGFAEGYAEGFAMGLRIGLRETLALRFQKKVTARTLARLEEADRPTLKRWIKNAGKARTLEAVFG
ncbi:MAG: hypothetical protein JNM17_31590 [Archangium sp.]|nr:hypothetical protein [Archangium sp.]